MGSEHDRLRDSIHKMTGMRIEDDKIYLIETRLGDVMREFNLKTYDEIAAKLEHGNDEAFIDRVIEKITTHETRFFRDESIFDALVMQIIPEFLERKGVTTTNPGNIKIDIWSAGCSTGQEAYSIAMVLNEKLPAVAKITSILGTDISRETIGKAKKGVYTKFEVERGVPDSLLGRYFTSLEGSMYQVNDSLKRNINFQYHNLLNQNFPGHYDIIFFRNVAIYFEEDYRIKLYNMMKNHIKKDGILVLGSAESLSGYIQDYIIREYGLARYYEVNASLVTIFNQ